MVVPLRVLARAAVLAIGGLSCLAPASPARADGEPKRSGFNFGEPPAGTEETPAADPSASTPIDRSDRAVRALLEGLRTWPQRSALRAAEALFLRGAEVVPYLVEVLRDGDPALQPGAAWVLGKVGEPVHVQVILGAAARRSQSSRADTFFKAAYGLDPDTARTWLVSFLSLSNRPVFRNEATRFLADHLTPQDGPKVLQLLDATKAGVRASGLALLRPAGVPDADARLLHALGDTSPEVAAQAASLLGQGLTKDFMPTLGRVAIEGDARERAYATLALVEAARAQREVAFDEELLRSWAGRRGLLHPDKLLRATAAAGLAYGAIGTADETIRALLDESVVEVLVDAVGGQHFRDYGSVRTHAFAALRHLTGKDLPETAVDWAGWWRGAKGSFRARRPLRDFEEIDAARARLRLVAVETHGLRRSVEFVSASSPARPDALYLENDAFIALIGFMRELGLFNSNATDGDRADEHIAVTLDVGEQRRRVVFAPAGDAEDDQRPYARLRLRLDALLEAAEWQIYVDTDRWHDRKVWWERNRETVAQASPDERRAFMVAAIVDSFDDMTDDRARAQALYRLQRLDEPLSAEQASLLARELASAPAFGAMETDGLRWILERGHAAVRGEILGSLAARTEREAKDILARILAEGGVAALREAFADPRPGMRAAAARGTRLLAEPRLDGSGAAGPAGPDRAALAARLLPGLEVLSGDPDPLVSVEALLARAWLGEAEVAKRLETLYQDGDLRARLEVVEGLGWLPGNAAHPFLTRVLAEERGDAGSALRAAALRAMARSKHKDAVRLLGYYLTNDQDPVVQTSAADALAEHGGDEARFMLVDDLVRGPSRADHRARLLDALGRFRGDVVVEQLRKSLDDTERVVVAVAALHAARHDMGEAVPYLIALLESGQGSDRDRARQALEYLTVQRFDEVGYSAVADRYRLWYERARVSTARAWFRDALKTRGYETSTLGAWLQGDADRAAVPVFLIGLRDADAVIRAKSNAALQHLSGRSFGELTVEASARRAEELAREWTAWHEAEQGVAAQGR